ARISPTLAALSKRSSRTSSRSHCGPALCMSTRANRLDSWEMEMQIMESAPKRARGSLRGFTCRITFRSPSTCLTVLTARTCAGGEVVLPGSLWGDLVVLLELAARLLADEVELLALPFESRRRRILGEADVSDW